MNIFPPITHSNTVWPVQCSKQFDTIQALFLHTLRKFLDYAVNAFLPTVPFESYQFILAMLNPCWELRLMIAWSEPVLFDLYPSIMRKRQFHYTALDTYLI